MAQAIQALLFDAEGVVIDTMRTVWIPADIEFCRRRGADCPNDLLIKLAGRTLREGVQVFKQYHGFTGDDEAMLQERLDLAVERFQKGVQFVDGFLDFYNQHLNIPRAIATSLRSEYLTMVDERLHVKQLFDQHVYSVYEVGTPAKPSPDIFLYAATQLGVLPENCVVFEDAPNGIEAARRAGMRCVAITTSFPRDLLKGATVIVDTFAEIDLRSLEK